ncbi:MAG: EAL domain-containing protein, partial [Motiliproteus sp.]
GKTGCIIKENDNYLEKHRSLQKERGISAGLISQKLNGDYRLELDKQRSLTMREYNKILPVLTTPPKNLTKKTKQNFQKIVSGFQQLEKIRKGIDRFDNIRFFNFYSELISELLQEVNVLHAMASTEEVNHMVSSLIYALGVEEYSGIERGLLHGYLNARQLNNEQPDSSIQVGLINHMARQKSELNRFYNVASLKHSKLMLEVINAEKTKEFDKFRRSLVNIIEQKNMLNAIVSIFGYGGLIYDYKESLISGDDINASKIMYDFRLLRNKLKRYEEKYAINSEDKQYLINFINVVDQYISSIDNVTKLKKLNTPVNKIVKSARVDDRPALEAVSKLRDSYQLIDPKLWWVLATQRIGLFHTVSSEIITDIIHLENIQKNSLKVPLVLYTVFVLVVVGIAGLLSYTLKNRLVNKIKNIAAFIKEARLSDQSNQLLYISGEDEISVMAHEFNQLMTERSKNDKKLRLAAQVFVEAHNGIFITETDGTIIDVNPAFSKITGYERIEVIGKNSRILNSQEQNDEFYSEMWTSLIEDGCWKGEIWNRKKDGELYAELLTISSLKDSGGKTIHYMALFSDITQIKNQHNILEQMAHYDALTLLPNRTLFLDRFKSAIVNSDNSKTSLAVCFIDLDNFKPVNDNYGHDVGDKILVEVSRRIQSNLRPSDAVSRQGGDEFALLLSDIHNFSDCEYVLKKIYDSFSQPYLIDGVYHQITASTGVTLYPQDDGDIDTLLRHADQAMYKAKLEGKHSYRLFNKENDQKIMIKQKFLNKINSAIDNNEFRLFYQPKVNMKTGEVYGAEALIRWVTPESGIISPVNFLPVVEGTEVEIKLAKWVVNEAIDQLASWHDQGLMIEVSINISSNHLQSANFIDDLKDVFNKYEKLDKRYIQIEILESSVLSDLDTISNTLRICRDDLGIQVALDDFGTGYSSLAHIKSLPADIIKIDQSFIIDMLDEGDNFNIIDGVLGLAQSFDRDVIAEGVETTAHGLILLIMGCEKAQGYGIAHPMKVSDFREWFDAYQPNKDWLDWAKKDVDQKNTSLKVFELAFRHEYTAIEKFLSSQVAETNEKIESFQNEICTNWINRNKNKTIFCTAWLSELESSYEIMHQNIQVFYQGYLSDPLDNRVLAKESMNESFNEMLTIINGAE